ncbi:MAG TPA: Arm DNA-binding domain-containing protein, partial [Hyphomicrobium sp.]|nr:Arm DNA-binding domain-containing protein [Hyphomicrobium sp.]
MPLTNAAIRTAKPGTAPIKISDAGGLHLLVQTNGTKFWRFANRFSGKQKTLALGIYPTVALAKARAIISFRSTPACERATVAVRPRFTFEYAKLGTDT